jgi:alkylated DNA repair dioxygenase AlkB
MNDAAAQIDRKAPVDRTDLDAGSWVDVVRRFAPEPDELFERLRRGARWRQGQSIREGRKIPDPRLQAGLSNAEVAANPTLRRAQLVLEARYRIRLRGAGLVLYRDGRDSVGFHSDDELRYLDRTVIAALCLGAERPVLLRPKSGSTTHTLRLGAGDLYVMGGRSQADWLHAVPKVAESGPRISVVWRWTSRQGPPSSSPGRFVPDAPRRRYVR